MASETPLPPPLPAVPAPADPPFYTLTAASLRLHVPKTFLRKVAAGVGLAPRAVGQALAFTPAQVAALERIIHRPRPTGVRLETVHGRRVWLPVKRPRPGPASAPGPSVFTVVETCAALRVSKTLLNRLRALAGVEPVARLGRSRLFTADQVDELRKAYDRYLPNRDKTVRHPKGTPRREEYGAV